MSEIEMKNGKIGEDRQERRVKEVREENNKTTQVEIKK